MLQMTCQFWILHKQFEEYPNALQIAFFLGDNMQIRFFYFSSSIDRFLLDSKAKIQRFLLLGNIANYLQMFEVEHMYLPVLVNFIFIGFEGTKPLTYVLKNLSVGSQKLIMYLNTLGFYKLKKFLLHSTRTGWTEVIISIIFFLSFTSITTSLFLLSK
ncbi:hypothetical protein L1987_81368 [Smallanthus sonchifolius]|uniref:Uncharacterized protein n=1 Tax=Smallanthus sonchifolius TaxID=185202 RepID=A0ACB8YQV4_9ASTR|nr:hypothetical protein L1987_81368 [Smallanthus sonchifolius]